MSKLNLTPETSALVIVDVQEKLANAIPEGTRGRTVRHLCWLIEGARRLGIPVHRTEQYPKGLGPTLFALREQLNQIEPPPPPLAKTEFDACQAESFAPALAELEGSGRTVVLAGMESHICIYQTARGLLERGIAVHIPNDACASRHSDAMRTAEGLWREAGATVTCTETVLFDWLGKAGGETFKAISRLLKEDPPAVGDPTAPDPSRAPPNVV